MKTKPFKHQAEEYEKHWFDFERALLWSMRTGKSKTIIDTACALYQACEIEGVLILGPNGVHLNWILLQLGEHHWDNVPYSGYAWRSSDPDKFTSADALRFVPGLAWLTVNMEVLIDKDVQKAISLFMRSRRKILLVVDESHHFGKPGSKRTKHARTLGKHSRYRRILTGTTIENSPLRAYSQYEILKRGALGFATYEEFQDNFAVFKRSRNRQYEILKNYKNLPDLRRSLAKYSSVVLREQCEDLPPIMPDTRYYEPSDAQRRLFTALKKQDIDILIELGFQEPPTGGALFTKLQQIEGGYLKTPGGLLTIGSPKFNIVLEEIEGYTSVIIWFEYIHEIENTAHELQKKGFTVGKVHGQAGNREDVLQAFKARAFPVLLAQSKSIGEGRDLSNAKKIIWYSQTPDAVVRSQASERATKVGGTSVEIIDIMCPHGIDEYYKGITTKKTAVADDVARRGLQLVLEGFNI